MGLGASQPGRERAPDRGFVLIEVLAAVAILGLLVVPLASAVQRACDSAVRLRSDAMTLSAESWERARSEAWEWGPMVERTVWSPGPELLITVPGDGPEEGSVGIWAGGWLVGEWPIPDDHALHLGPDIWGEWIAQELVVRMRTSEGPWGPPYRTVVPDQYGDVGIAPAGLVAAAEESARFGDPGTASHVRYSGAVSLEDSGGEESVAEIAEDIVAVLDARTAGLRDLSCADRTQSWVASDRRRLDVYW